MIEPIPPETPRRLGIYELLEKIGVGGMSTVFKGRNTKTNEIVAVKVASRAVIADPQASKRFELEYESVLQLQHPCLAKVHDCGRDGNTSYLVMEYVDGPSLSQRLKNEGRIDEPEATTIFLQVADALTYLHDEQIIHRDIKPGNILQNSQGQVKVVDFGLCKNLKEGMDLTRSRIGLGTMQFASPEQFDDARSADARCDIYSLGATMYWTVTGEAPYGLGSPINILQRKLLNQFDPPIKKNAKISPSVDAAIRLSLHHDRSCRPASCREMMALWTGARAVPVGVELPGAVAKKESKRFKSKAAEEKERRVRIRYGTELKSSCRSIAEPGPNRWQAIIKDISTTGMRLRVSRRFEVGNVLDILFTMRVDGMNTSQVTRVRWIKQADDKAWLMGCEFVSPLSEDDLESFLNHQMNKTDMTR